MTTLRYLGTRALRDALPMSAAIDAIEGIMRAASAGDARAPARSVQSIPRLGREDCVFLVMPGTWGERGAAADTPALDSDNSHLLQRFPGGAHGGADLDQLTPLGDRHIQCSCAFSIFQVHAGTEHGLGTVENDGT